MKRIIAFLLPIQETAKKNPGISLLLFNLFLGFFLIGLKDPGGWFANTYKNADPFFDIDEEEIHTIVSGRKGQESRIERNLDGWTVTLESNFSAPGDSGRIEELIKVSLALRKFTLLSGSDAAISSEFGLDGDEPVLEFLDVSGKSLGKIIIGALAQKSSGTYVMDQTNKIWLVKENLKLVTGGGKRDYFLTRSLISDLPTREKILEIHVQNSLRSEEYRLTQDDQKNWVLQVSNRDIPVLTEEVEKFIDLLKNLKADEIYFNKFEEIQPVSTKQNFRIEIRTNTDTYSIFPVGLNKLGSYVFQRVGLDYKLVLDPWNLERILQKDLSDFTIPSGPSNKQF